VSCRAAGHRFLPRPRGQVHQGPQFHAPTCS
jgi:hypothetical protein